MSLADLIGAPAHERRLLFSSGAARLTYGEAARASLGVARQLMGSGLRERDRVLLNLANGPDWLVGFFGVLRAGGVVVLAGAEPEAVRSQPGNRWVLEGQLSPTMDSADPGRFPTLHPDDDAVLLYTSGSQGIPRGVLKTHRNLLTELEYLRQELSGPVERFLSVLPWGYIYGLIHHVLVPIRLGATIYTVPRYTPTSLAAAIERHAIDVLVGVPSLYRVIARSSGAAHTARLRWAVCSGAPLDPTTVDLLAAHGCRLVEVYGSTEAGAIAINLDKARSPDSVGHVVPHSDLQVQLHDDDAREGTLLVRGPTVSTRAVEGDSIVSLTNQEGWYDVGDRGHVRADGQLQLVSRASRIIKVDGRRSSLDEIEHALLRLPGVVDVVASASPDAIHGELPAVEIALDRRAEWTEELLLAAWRQLLPHFKRPKSLRLVHSIAHGDRGKQPG